MRTARLLWLVILITTVPIVGAAQSSWQRVDKLHAGKRINITLATGEATVYRFKSSSAGELVLAMPDGGEKIIAKSEIIRVAVSPDPGNAAKIGAWVGAGAFAAFLQAAAHLCQKGCENDMPVAALPVTVGFGAGVGAVAGYFSGRTGAEGAVLYSAVAEGRPFERERYPTVQIGVSSGQARFREYSITGRTAMNSGHVGVLLSPRMSLEFEFAKPRTTTFLSSNAKIHDLVAQGLLPPSAIPRQEQHSSRVSKRYEGLVGVHVIRSRRMNMSLLAGLGLHPKESTTFGPGNRLSEFRSPGEGPVYGVDVGFKATKHLSLDSRLRHDATFGPRYSAGLSWRL